MTIRRKLFRTLVAGLLLAPVLLVTSARVATADASEEARPYVEPSELTSVLKSRNVDQILDTLNRIKQMRYQQQVLPLLVDLWNLRQDKYSDFPWDIISLDVVRLDIGNVLAQAGRNGVIEVDSNAIHEFAVQLIRSADVDVASNALWTLSIFDRDQDVAAVKKIALTEQGKLFHAAVITLASMCNDDAAEALKDLGSANLTPDQLGYVVETAQRFAEFKSRTRSCQKSVQ